MAAVFCERGPYKCPPRNSVSPRTGARPVSPNFWWLDNNDKRGTLQYVEESFEPQFSLQQDLSVETDNDNVYQVVEVWLEKMGQGPLSLSECRHMVIWLGANVHTMSPGMGGW